jgi:hypothetical protein
VSPQHHTELDPFQERLLSELRAHVDERVRAGAPEPPRPSRGHRRRTRLALAGGVAVVAIGTAIVVTGGDGAPAAFAVEPQDDGSVSVEIRGPGDAEQLERKLADAGVPADVTYLPAGKACAPDRVTPAEAGVPADQGTMTSSMSGSMGAGQDGATQFTIAPGQLAAGQTLVLEIAQGTLPDGHAASSVAMTVAQGAVGACEVVDASTIRAAPADGRSAPGVAGVQAGGDGPTVQQGSGEGPSFDGQGG